MDIMQIFKCCSYNRSNTDDIYGSGKKLAEESKRISPFYCCKCELDYYYYTE